MGKEVILHIGKPKTGTTSIQKCLATNREILSAHGILYPTGKRMRWKHSGMVPLIRAQKRDAEGVQIMARRMFRKHGEAHEVEQVAREEWQTIQTQCKEFGGSRVILSSENLFFPMDAAEISNYREMMSQIDAESIRAIVYLRSPVAGYLSDTQQRLKGRGKKLGPPTPTYFIRPLQSYEKAFGEPVRTRVFERERLIAGDIVEDFLTQINLGSLELARPEGHDNTSLSAEAMKVLTEFGEEDAFSSAATAARQRWIEVTMIRLDGETPGQTKPRLKEEVAAYIEGINKDLVPLRDQYGIEFSDIDYAKAGRGGKNTSLVFGEVENICDVNTERYEHLREEFKKELSER